MSEIIIIATSVALIASAVFGIIGVASLVAGLIHDVVVAA